MSAPQINSITVGLPVSDLPSAIQWYRQLLGEREEAVPAPDMLEILVTPTFWLQLFEDKATSSGSSIVRFEAQDIYTAHEIASQIGVDVQDVETVPDVVCYFDFRDPFGNQLSFYQILAQQE